MIGRFIQEDSYLGDGLNLFAYCQNNPLVYFDPTGHFCSNKQQCIFILQEHQHDGISELTLVSGQTYEQLYEKLKKEHGNSPKELRKYLEDTYGPSRFEDTYKLRAFNEYTVNGYTYQTDEYGRIISASGYLNLEDGKRFSNHQTKAGGEDRITGNENVSMNDDGGHLFATIFNGSGRVDNMVAMNSNLNRGDYETMEAGWASILKENKNAKIFVSIDIDYPDNSESMRPEALWVNATNETTGTVLETNRYFENRNKG